MKQAVILAGGFGTRLSEETMAVPKPMVTIGGTPILVHIMRYYAHFGVSRFTIALGYKGNVIKEYFANYLSNNCDIRLNLPNREIEYLTQGTEAWTVELIDTGLNTQTGGRLKRLISELDDDFFLTYGDGLSNVNLNELEHKFSRRGKTGIITAVKPPSKYGYIEIDDCDSIMSFREKVDEDTSLINGGFFAFKKEICDFIEDDEPLEVGPFRRLVEQNQLSAHVHRGFWQCMDTLRDRNLLEKIWETGNAPWSSKFS